MNEVEHLDRIREDLESLSLLLPVFEAAIGKPDFVPILDGSRAEHFRYRNPGPRTIQYLLLVRLVSGCRAVHLLLLHGHIVEAGVLLRTLDEFLGDFTLVEESFRNPGGPNATQQRFIKNYFLESTDPKKQHVADDNYPGRSTTTILAG